MKRNVILLFLLLFIFASPTFAGEERRPSEWASPVAGGIVKNFYRLDGKVYRSAQPDDEDMEALAKYGIQEILNLRQFHDDDDEAKGTVLKLHHVPMNAGEIRDEDVIRALTYIRDSKGPIVIHCWHGSDRTGTIAAMYRIVFHGWSKADAIDELVHGGYGYHAAFYGNIPRYIERVDVERIRRALSENN